MASELQRRNWRTYVVLTAFLAIMSSGMAEDEQGPQTENPAQDRLAKIEETSLQSFKQLLSDQGSDFDEVVSTSQLKEWPYVMHFEATRDSRTVARGMDVTADGRVDSVMLLGETGHLAKILTDRNMDGRLDEWSYFREGEPTGGEADRNYDGKIDYWWEHKGKKDTVFEVDLYFRGERTRKVLESDGEIVSVKDDRNGDGKYDVWWKTSQEGGYVVKVDRNFDGQADMVREYADCTLSENFSGRLADELLENRGRLVRVEEDLNMDGTIDGIRTRGPGDRWEQMNDLNLDGKMDSWSFYQNDAGVFVYDGNFDGKRDIWIFKWPGAIDITVKDTDGDEKPDTIVPEKKYEWKALGERRNLPMPGFMLR